MVGAPCGIVEPPCRGGHRQPLMWCGLRRRRKKLPVVRLGDGSGGGGGEGGGRGRGRGGGGGRGRGVLRRLRLRWLRRAVRRLAAIYVEALVTGPPRPRKSPAYWPWVGVDTLFALPFL